MKNSMKKINLYRLASFIFLTNVSMLNAGLFDVILQVAVRDGSVSLAKVALYCGAEIDEQYSGGLPGPDFYGFTPLYVAVSKGHFDVAKLLLENGANPNKGNNLNWHDPLPLHIAATDADQKMIVLLLGFGAFADAEASFGHTPLFNACMAVRISEGCSLVPDCCSHAFCKIDEFEKIDCVALFLARGANTQNGHVQSYAARQVQTELVAGGEPAFARQISLHKIVRFMLGMQRAYIEALRSGEPVAQLSCREDEEQELLGAQERYWSLIEPGLKHEVRPLMALCIEVLRNQYKVMLKSGVEPNFPNPYGYCFPGQANQFITDLGVQFPVASK